jgi:anti-sigma factor RsiW
MFRTPRHPSDRVLVWAIDGELSPRRKGALDAHLRHCDRCRTRFASLAALGDEVTQLCLQGAGPSTPRPALRNRLQAEMTARAVAWNRLRWFRLRKAINTLPLALRMGVSAAVVILMLQTIWQSWTTVPPTSADVEAAALPIHMLTPGAARPMSLDVLCAGRSVDRPPVAPTVRDVVLRGYRMEHVAAREYELDYLITPELGGVPDARNLWPERYATSVWNARVKDELEDLLPQLICRGQVDLPTAQREIADNWIAAYKKYFRTDHPIRRPADLHDDDDARPRHTARVSASSLEALLVLDRSDHSAWR